MNSWVHWSQTFPVKNILLFLVSSARFLFMFSGTESQTAGRHYGGLAFDSQDCHRSCHVTGRGLISMGIFLFSGKYHNKLWWSLTAFETQRHMFSNNWIKHLKLIHFPWWWNAFPETFSTACYWKFSYPVCRRTGNRSSRRENTTVCFPMT